MGGLGLNMKFYLRSAHKLKELCFKNGGIYIKLGQHIGQLVCYIVLTLFPSMLSGSDEDLGCITNFGIYGPENWSIKMSIVIAVHSILCRTTYCLKSTSRL